MPNTVPVYLPSPLGKVAAVRQTDEVPGRRRPPLRSACTCAIKRKNLLPFDGKELLSSKFLLTYSMTSSSDTITAMLITIQMELIALDRPTSPSISPVKPGTAAPIGANARITSA